MKFEHWNIALLIAGLVAAPKADAVDTAEEIRLLREQIQQLDQKVKILERKTELDSEAAETRKSETPRVSAGAGGFSISSADTNFVLKLRGYVQADGRHFFNDGLPVNDTFLLRRVRPIFEGTVFEHYDYRVMLDFASGLSTVSNNVGLLQDAYLNVHYWPQFQVQFGKFKEPVGLERLQSGGNLLFVERGYPTQLVPNRDVGIQIHGELFQGALNYAAGVFNGVADGGSGDIDTDDDEKDFAARIFTHPFKNTEFAPFRGLGFGLAGTIGNHEGPLRSYSTPGQQKFFAFNTGAGTNATTPNVRGDGEQWRISPQAYYYCGPLGLLAEYVISSQNVALMNGGPIARARLENKAWQVAASYILTGEENSFKPLVPRHPFSWKDEGWGAWEVTGRFGQLSIDKAAFPLFATSSSANEATSWALGLNWYLNRNVKINLNYEQTHFRGGSTKPGSVTAQDEQVFLSRVQFGF
jgi:phosphate-selective porin OprO and OprP